MVLYPGASDVRRVLNESCQCQWAEKECTANRSNRRKGQNLKWRNCGAATGSRLESVASGHVMEIARKRVGARVPVLVAVQCK